jgi:hypothetical protein
VDAEEVRAVGIGCLPGEEEECRGSEPGLVSKTSTVMRGYWKGSYMATRLAATLARCTMHCTPTSIAGECSCALADTRHHGRFETVKAMASPAATIQAVTTNRMAYFDSVSRHAGDVKKLFPAG